MREREMSGVTVDVCSQCGGIWFDAGEIEETFRRQYDERIDEIPKDVHFKTFGPASDTACPRCSKAALRLGVVKGVPFRTCTECCGVFVKAPDLQRLATVGPPSTELFDMTRVDPLDVILETLLFGLEGAILLHVRRRLAETIGEELR